MTGARPEVGARPVAVFDGGAWATREDAVAAEEPLEIRLSGDAVAVTMRSPGRDHDLVLGFLLAEGLIASMADVGKLAHCGRPGTEGFGNVIDVAPGPGTQFDLERRAVRRGGLTTSACGVCGRATVDDLLARVSPVDAPPVAPDTVRAAVAGLRAVQPAFDATGGVHAAAAFSAEGALLAAAEDVGRHNATDKVCGALLRDGKRAALLVVSGRVGFEIVQKALASRIGAVAGVSAPTTLAVDLAQRARMQLFGFVRGERLNVYAGPPVDGASP